MIPDVADLVARFADRLHLAGIAVSPERAGRLAAALDIAAPSTTNELYWLARVTVAGDRTELATFDAVFDEVFRGLVDVADSRGASGAAAPTAGCRARRSTNRHRDRRGRQRPWRAAATSVR